MSRGNKSHTAILTVEPGDYDYEAVFDKIRAVGFPELRVAIHAATAIELTNTIIELHTELAAIGASETIISVEETT